MLILPLLVVVIVFVSEPRGLVVVFRLSHPMVTESAELHPLLHGAPLYCPGPAGAPREARRVSHWPAFFL